MKHILTVFALCLATTAQAGDSEIVKVNAVQSGAGWHFEVTLKHDDSGWDHYADGWRVLDMNGKELGMRILAHPHENEQPFTRSLSGVTIPAGTKQVQIQARAKPHGWGAATKVVNLK